MVIFKDLQDYVHQSTLLLSARPATTRITTRYSLCSANKSSRRLRRGKVDPKLDATEPTTTDEATPAVQAVLVLKTYDPVSGAVLKYQTDRAAEVGRLTVGLSRCGRLMAAQEEKPEASTKDLKHEDYKQTQDQNTRGSGANNPEKKAAEQQQQQQGRAAGAGKKKKKR